VLEGDPGYVSDDPDELLSEVRRCVDAGQRLTDWEDRFSRSVRDQHYRGARLTGKQADHLRKLVKRLRGLL
jgi:hypothetical protein